MRLRTLLLVAVAMAVGGLVVATATGQIDLSESVTDPVSSSDDIDRTPVPEAGSSAFEDGTVAYHGDFLRGKFENHLKGAIQQSIGRVERPESLNTIAQDVAGKMAVATSTGTGIEGLSGSTESVGCLNPTLARVSVELDESSGKSENAISDRVVRRISSPEGVSRVGIGSRIGTDDRLYVAVLFC